MKVIGIIAEYDPFHNGHLYQIEYAKKELQADAVVVVMSGDYTQRGEPAVIDKYARAKMAILGGADLVLMMPVAYSTSSAEYFATSGVGLLDETGIVTDLLCGAETDDLAHLKQIAEKLSAESDEFRSAINENLEKGMAYAKARALACDPEDAALMEQPNNILAIEYLKALKKRHSTITPHILLRKEASYDGQTRSQSMASASYIRAHINGEALSSYIPISAWEILEEKKKQKELLSVEDAYAWYQYKRLHDRSVDCEGSDLTIYADLSSDLAKRIEKVEMDPACDSMQTLIDRIKAKNFTRAAICRAICHILLDIRTDDRCDPAPYLRILDFSERGKLLAKSMQDEAGIPVFSNVNEGLRLLSAKQNAAQMLQKDIYAANLYALYLSQKNGRVYPDERRRLFTPTASRSDPNRLR